MRYLIPLFIAAMPVLADAPKIADVRSASSSTIWRFDVTLTHPDTGWGHYANGWRVEMLSGEVLGLRELTHPHVNEQPFTRWLSEVEVPLGITEVQIRARCIVDGWSDEVFIRSLE